MERYLGIDAHRDSSTVCVLSAGGKRASREVVETNAPVLIRHLKTLAGTLHVCIEESPWSEWLYEVLSPHVAELVVYQNEWTPGPKSDAIDAHGLAEKLRIGQAGPGVFKSPKRYRKLREWARVYQALNRDLTRVKNRLKAQFLRRGLRTTGTSVYSPEHRADWLQQLTMSVDRVAFGPRSPFVLEHHELGCVRREDLVEPLAPRALLEADVPGKTA